MTTKGVGKASARQIFDEMGVAPGLQDAYFRLDRMLHLVHAQLLVDECDGEYIRPSKLVSTDDRYRIIALWNAGHTPAEIVQMMSLDLTPKQVRGLLDAHRKRRVARNTTRDGDPVATTSAVVDDPELIQAMRDLVAAGHTADIIAIELRRMGMRRKVSGYRWNAKAVHRAAGLLGLTVARVALRPCCHCHVRMKYNALPKHERYCVLWHWVLAQRRLGRTYAAIANQLNCEGRIAPRGVLWTAGHLKGWTNDRRRKRASEVGVA